MSAEDRGGVILPKIIRGVGGIPLAQHREALTGRTSHDDVYAPNVFLFQPCLDPAPIDEVASERGGECGSCGRVELDGALDTKPVRCGVEAGGKTACSCEQVEH